MLGIPPRILILAAVIVAFLGVFLMVALRRTPPVIPGDEIHGALEVRGEACMSCHGAGGVKPRGPNHPFGHQCGSCHYRAGEAR